MLLTESAIVETTIDALRALPAPAALPATRIPPTETTVYRIHATLTAYKREADGDYHLVLTNPSEPNGLGTKPLGTNSLGTIIAEIPDPRAVDERSPFRTAITAARSLAEAHLPVQAPGAIHTTSLPVTVTGVGFFDRLHGQTGCAPNGIELHPVIALTFLVTLDVAA